MQQRYCYLYHNFSDEVFSGVFHSQLFFLYWIEISYFVDDGCNTEKFTKNSPANDIKSSYQVKAYKAGVRCCNVKDDKCETIGKCPDDATTYDDAVKKCAAKGLMLCTKNQILRGVCCGARGGCDHYPVWTSTPQKQGGKYDGKLLLFAIQGII